MLLCFRITRIPTLLATLAVALYGAYIAVRWSLRVFISIFQAVSAWIQDHWLLVVLVPAIPISVFLVTVVYNILASNTETTDESKEQRDSNPVAEDDELELGGTAYIVDPRTQEWTEKR